MNMASAVMGHLSVLWALAAVDGPKVKIDTAKSMLVVKISDLEKQSPSPSALPQH